MVTADQDFKDAPESVRSKDEPTPITASDARNNMGDLLDRVLGGERITITRHGKPIAALVGPRDLEALAAVA